MGELPRVTYVGHSTLRVDLGGRSVLTDPVLGRSVEGVLWRYAAMPGPSTWQGVDLVVLSHLHHDHCDLPSLRRIGHDVPVLVPAGGGEWLARQGFRAVHEMDLGDVYVDGQLRVRAVPAVHSGRRRAGPIARALGYVLSAGTGSTYFAGDTDLFDAMSDLGDVDVALLPVWGWGPDIGPGHLDPVRAVEATARLRARHVVPIHYGTLFPVGLKSLLGKDFGTQGAVFAELVRRSGLDVHVALTPPGQLAAVES
ncbi:MAG TPA: MBL fold metallo-hydrolase [Actinomycetes bacterium]|nr:MBL fold metallo-hydrolase [Actinomycetes bacterium]